MYSDLSDYWVLKTKLPQFKPNFIKKISRSCHFGNWFCEKFYLPNLLTPKPDNFWHKYEIDCTLNICLKRLHWKHVTGGKTVFFSAVAVVIVGGLGGELQWLGGNLLLQTHFHSALQQLAWWNILAACSFKPTPSSILKPSYIFARPNCTLSNLLDLQVDMNCCSCSETYFQHVPAYISISGGYHRVVFKSTQSLRVRSSASPWSHSHDCTPKQWSNVMLAKRFKCKCYTL